MMQLSDISGAQSRWTCDLAPLGVPTVVIAEDPSLLQAAVSPYAGWEADASVAPAITLRLERRMMPAARVGFRIAAEGSRLSIMGNGIAGWADAVRGQARCSLSPDTDAKALAEAVETLLLFLLTRSGRTPVHASAIVVGGRALLLAGPSGAGKSTLALAAARRRLPVLSDDTVYVQTEPRLRVWGMGGAIHVLPQDAPPATHGTRLRGGRLKLAVAQEAADAPRFAERAAVILLSPGVAPGLGRTNGEEALARLGRLEAGFDLLREESAAAHRALLAQGDAWTLTLSHDPAEAIDLLCERFGGLSGDAGNRAE